MKAFIKRMIARVRSLNPMSKKLEKLLAEMANILIEMYARYEIVASTQSTITRYEQLVEGGWQREISAVYALMQPLKASVSSDLAALSAALTVYNRLVFDYSKRWPNRPLPYDVVIEPTVKAVIENYRRGIEQQQREAAAK